MSLQCIQALGCFVCLCAQPCVAEQRAGLSRTAVEATGKRWRSRRGGDAAPPPRRRPPRRCAGPTGGTRLAGRADASCASCTPPLAVGRCRLRRVVASLPGGTPAAVPGVIHRDSLRPPPRVTRGGRRRPPGGAQPPARRHGRRAPVCRSRRAAVASAAATLSPCSVCHFFSLVPVFSPPWSLGDHTAHASAACRALDVQDAQAGALRPPLPPPHPRPRRGFVPARHHGGGRGLCRPLHGHYGRRGGLCDYAPV